MDMHEDLRDMYRTGVFSVTELAVLSGLSLIQTESIVKRVRVEFTYSDITGYFDIWPNDKVWQWEALGANGEEASQNQAIDKARLWIRESRL